VINLPDGYTAEPATDAEAREAFRKGQIAGADFVILSREKDENGAEGES